MKLPRNIVDIINSNKTSLGDNPALPPEMNDKFLVYITEKYYKELLTHFDYVDIDELSEDLSSTIVDCKNIEADNKETLEKACSIIVNELFHIPEDTVILDMKLVDKVDVKQERLVPEDTRDYSFDSIEDMNNLTDEIYKRRMLNALINGAAMYYAEDVNSYRHILENINSDLIGMYKKIMCINDLLLFNTKQSINGKQTDGGRVDVYIASQEIPVRINAQGVLFTVLLEETIKGLLELSIAHGLPSERGKAEFVTSKADFKLAEIWDQRLGIPLWKRLLEVFKEIDEDPIEVGLNFFFMEISKLNTKHFNSFMQETLAKTNDGKSMVKSIVNKIRYQKEKDDFDEYISQQSQISQLPINDEEECFSSDELINDDLCSNTILDEEDF